MAPLRWKSIEKEIIDNIIFRTTKVHNQSILERVARSDMRNGTVLTRKLDDLQDRKLVLCVPKSGKQYAFVFIPRWWRIDYGNTPRRYAMRPAIGYPRFPMKRPNATSSKRANCSEGLRLLQNSAPKRAFYLVAETT